jgi:hypothetical protein
MVRFANTASVLITGDTVGAVSVYRYMGLFII